MPEDRDRPVRTGSLSRRVVLAVLALLLAVLVGLGLVVNVLVGERLRRDARQRLVERAGYASVLAASGVSTQELADGLTGQGITASVRNGSTVVVGRDRPPRQGEPGAPPPRPRPRAASTSITVTQRGQQLSVQIDVAGGQLLLTSSLAEIDCTLGILHNVELGAGLATLLIAGVVLAVVVGAVLAPLRRMTELAHRIRAGARGRRLRPTRPNTDLGRTATAMDAMLDALETAEADARAAEARMRRLLSDVSHDLRTPIAGVITSAEQLLRADPGRAGRERRLVELIRESRRAARLVDDLLLMARLDDGATDAPRSREPVELRSVAESAAARARDSGRRVELVVAESAVVPGDADRLARVVTNLLDNARDATAPGGRITLRIGVEDGCGVLDVHDDGPGVPDGEHERIFDRLVRLDPSRRSGGSGLGLSIARAIARSHGGELCCLPSEEGAHFRLILSGASVPARPDVEIPLPVG